MRLNLFVQFCEAYSLAVQKLFKMSSKASNSNTTAQRSSTQQIYPQSLMKMATLMVDSVTDLLYNEIIIGHLQVNEQEKQLLPNNNSIIVQQESKTLDIDQHKRKVRKFMLMNKKHRKNRQKRSIQHSQHSIRLAQVTKQQQEQTKQKILSDRRQQIQRRMNQKKLILQEIKRSALDSNVRVSSLKKKKLLHEQKQEEYYKNVVLPQLQYEKSVLNKKKELRKPINMTELFQHEKKYEEFKINQKLNRSVTVRMVKKSDYEPPDFVPESYKRAKLEEQLAKEQQQFRLRELEMNGIKKKQYCRKIQEIRQKQRELSRSLLKTPQKPQIKEKIKPVLNRQELKTVGNQYLKELLAKNRKFATTKKLFPIEEQSPKKRKVRSEYEIEIVKEQRIEKVKKIRNKKIDEIFNDEKLNQYERYEKLKYEIEKLDKAAQDKFHESSNLETVNESASIMMSSIHAKLALLNLNSPKK